MFKLPHCCEVCNNSTLCQADDELATCSWHVIIPTRKGTCKRQQGVMTEESIHEKAIEAANGSYYGQE